MPLSLTRRPGAAGAKQPQNSRRGLACQGGPTIINTVLQVLINVIDHGMDIQRAIDWPRIHHQWMPDQITYEPYGLSPNVLNRLKEMGHKFVDRPRNMGDAEGIMIEDKTGVRLGGRDPRLDGHSVGY